MSLVQNLENILQAITATSFTCENLIDTEMIGRAKTPGQLNKMINDGLSNDLCVQIFQLLVKSDPVKRQDLKQHGINIYSKTIHVIPNVNQVYLVAMLKNMIEAARNKEHIYPVKNPAEVLEENEALEKLKPITIDELQDALASAKTTPNPAGSDYLILRGYSYKKDNKKGIENDKDMEEKQIAFKLTFDFKNTDNPVLFTCLNPVIL